MFPKANSLVLAVLFLLLGQLALADQTAKELPALFDQLAQASESEEARQIEAQIWQLWLEAPDESSGLIMSQVSQALGGGELELALRLSNQLVDSAPQYAEAWNKRATIHYLMGSYTASVSDIRETLALEPRHFGAISGLGLIFLREQNLEAALQAFEQVLSISPASENAMRSAERVRAEIGREI